MNKKLSFATCLLWGMLWGIVLGVAIDKLAMGIALGNMFGTMYYLFLPIQIKTQMMRIKKILKIILSDGK